MHVGHSMKSEKVWMRMSIMSLPFFIPKGICANEKIWAPITYGWGNEHTVGRSWIRGEGGHNFKMMVMLLQV